MADSTMQLFGGDWTEQKLAVLAKYLRAYTTALKKTPFKLMCIDGFAGTGYRELAGTGGGELFAELSAPDASLFRDGSAKIALDTVPPFHHFEFIEAKEQNRQELEKLKAANPQRSMNIVTGDANQCLVELCARSPWRSTRAVLFLDPFGMQVEWSTIEAIAKTEAIDLWYLFPSGIGVNRLLAETPDSIPSGWRARLDKVLGTKEWADRFYQSAHDESLFGPQQRVKREASADAIADYFRQRLESCFPGVAKNPGRLKNSSGTVLYHLFFAASNQRGAPIALDIAEHLLKGL